MADSFIDLTSSSPPGAQNVNVEAELDKALSTMTASRLRGLLAQLYKENDTCRNFLKNKVLVPEHEVIPYHADSDSEDKEETSEEEELGGEQEENEDEDIPESSKRKRTKSPQMLTSRFAICENCNEEFDVTENKRGDCSWHPGTKEAYFDDDFWADHDEDCHGRIDDLKDESDYEDGFIWTCCDGDKLKISGCKQTKHRFDGGPVKRARY